MLLEQSWTASRVGAHQFMTQRRQFLKQLLGITAGAAASRGLPVMARTSSDSFTMPDEGAPHKCTWMAFIANKTIWSRRQRPAVERELALIAKTIARYEPVSLLVPQSHKARLSRYKPLTP